MGALRMARVERAERSRGRHGYRVHGRWVTRAVACLICVQGSTLGVIRTAYAYDNYQTGHISRVAFSATSVLIMLDSGTPANCAGSAYGWMMISSSSAPMVAFVTALWMRGTASQDIVTVYTNTTDSTGYCQISQIDTGSAGG